MNPHKPEAELKIERYFAEPMVKLIATRFAKASRDKQDVTSNDTIGHFEKWIAEYGDNFKSVDYFKQHTRITELEAINKSYETNTDNMHHLVEKLDNRIVELDGEKTVLTSRVAELETYIGGIQSDLEANFPDSFDRENLLLDIENFLGTTKP